MQQFNSLYELLEVFSSEQVCIDHLRKIRWKNDEYCPHCGSVKVYHFSDNKTHKCGDCRKKFSIKVGTIFEDSKIPLRKWFIAIYFATSHKKGISSLQLSKDIKVTQKTAWFMLQRLRFASQTKSFNAKLSGDIEVDETYIGGKEKNKHNHKKEKGTQGRSTKTKSMAFGMLQRNGELRIFALKDAKRKTIMPQVANHIEYGSRVITDEFGAYAGLSDRYIHKVVTHSLGEYVVGNNHTNTIEGAWSLFKRGVIGIYHHISKKHLAFYLDEFSYRYNTRGLNEGQRVNHFLSRTDGRLTYAELIS